jgi:8-oxo-dGTP diphosphatase
LPGGILEIGESPAECARREAREETGLSVRPIRLASILSGPRHEILYPNGDRVQQTTFFFECSIEGGSLRAGGDESSTLAFFPADHLPPTLPWYLAALEVQDSTEPYFDPPEFSPSEDEPPESPAWAMLRARIGSAPLILPGATALLRDARGHALLVRRKDSGLWSMPGGPVELGENLAAAVIRETAEEVGLRVDPIRIRGIFGGHRVAFHGGDTLYPISTWFECAIRSGVPRPDEKEVDRAEFHDAAALPEMAPGLRERLTEVLASPRAAVFH